MVKVSTKFSKISYFTKVNKSPVVFHFKEQKADNYYLGTSWLKFIEQIFIGIKNYYRPQRSWGKVMFLHVSVILLTEGVCPIACWDTTQDQRQAPPPPPPADTPPGPGTPQSRHPPAWEQTLLGPGTPPRTDTPLGSRQPLPRPGTHPPGADTPQGSACWEIQAISGWYASYWNAILFIIQLYINVM